MAGIPEQVIEEIRDRADIVETVGRYVTLRKAGNRFWGLCPFHTEKTPSFSVNPERQIFYCFGCEAHGDVFSFRMRQDGSLFPDAARGLAAELGIAIPEASSAESGWAARLHAANACALAYFREQLRTSRTSAGARYLERRNLPAELVDRFQLGFAPPGWTGLLDWLRSHGISVEDAEGAGLVCPRQTGDGHYDRFRNRVMFPILDPGGRIAGFGGRSLEDDTPKYMNSPETAIYHKGRVLFGLPLALDAIRKRDRAILVEGYFDVFALHRAGLCEAVAPCGTALTSEHARRLRRYTREVVLLFDGDTAGQRAAERSLPVLLAEGLRVRAAFLPEGDDPDTLLAKQGEAALRARVEDADRLLDSLIDRQLGFARGSAWESSDALERVVPLLRSLPDPMERASYVRSVASRLEVPPQVVESSLRTASARSPSDRSVRAAPPAVRPAPEDALDASEIESVHRELLSALAAYPKLATELPELWPELADAPDSTVGEWIPDTRVCRLLTCVLAAAERHGDDSVAHLLSPADDALPAPLRTAFSAIVSGAGPASPADARSVLRDCLERMRARKLSRRQRLLRDRLESCSEPAQQDRLLEEMQQLLEEKQRQDQRQRTGPAPS